MRNLLNKLKDLLGSWEAVIVFYDGETSIPVAWYEVETGKFVEVTEDTIYRFPKKSHVVIVSPSEMLTRIDVTGEAAPSSTEEQFEEYVPAAFDAGEYSYEATLPESELIGLYELLQKSGSVAKVFSLFSCYRALREGCYLELFCLNDEKAWLIEVQVGKGIDRARVFFGTKEEVFTEALSVASITAQAAKGIFFYSTGFDEDETDRLISLVKGEGGAIEKSGVPYFVTVPVSKAVEYPYVPILKMRSQFRFRLLIFAISASAAFTFLVQDIRALQYLMKVKQVKQEIEEYKRAINVTRAFIEHESAKVVPAVLVSKQTDVPAYVKKIFASVPDGTLLDRLEVRCKKWKCTADIVLRVQERFLNYDVLNKQFQQELKKRGLSFKGYVAAKGNARYIKARGVLR